ncbi:uncharacterized protein RCC_08053 [Ramularia collo-cygni]|uniref:SnoaL-like domain-containing protein n=1 Tax=Ramularia collo-cygni TaxID=112498 RepID=A0A2D3VGX1_9PEZI|nr:uncharacterized protein RCC_08053 [Ramularia collo-cygni]CZT22184.1 uncharacterized protein RCC_08053 [Ramularia collo-cygni]
MDRSNPTLLEFLQEEESPSTLLPTLTARAISLLSSRSFTSPFFPHNFIPQVPVNIDGQKSTGLQSLLDSYRLTVRDNPNLKVHVLDSAVGVKGDVAWVTCNVKSEGFADGVSRAGTVMAKWITTDDGWRCGKWEVILGMALGFWRV